MHSSAAPFFSYNMTMLYIIGMMIVWGRPQKEICPSIVLAKQAQLCHQNDLFNEVCKKTLTNNFNSSGHTFLAQ